jgi:hypothetical protein
MDGDPNRGAADRRRGHVRDLARTAEPPRDPTPPALFFSTDRPRPGDGVTKRFARLFERVGAGTGRELRLVDDRERQLLEALFPTATPAAHRGELGVLPGHADGRLDHKEAV